MIRKGLIVAGILIAGILGSVIFCSKNPASSSAPTITKQPQSDTRLEGGSVTFTVVTKGDPAPTFQWYKNDTLIPGATGSSYTITGVTSADSGSYTVVVTNSAGSVTSNPATLALGLTGVWSGDTSRYNGGAGGTDSFGVVLTITETGYSLVRGNLEWGSSDFIRDSSKEFGSWAMTLGGDSVIFSPDTIADTCFKWDFGDGTWSKCDGIHSPFCDCGAPIQTKIDITHNVWRALIPNFKDPAEIFTYYLKKQ